MNKMNARLLPFVVQVYVITYMKLFNPHDCIILRVEDAVKKFEHHPSIDLINKNITNNESFHSSQAEHESISKEIINLDNKRNKTFKSIPARRLKDVSDVGCPILANIWNKEIMFNKSFSENLKLADVTPIFQKKESFCWKLQTVSVLPIVSKIFERIMQKQITDYIGKFLSSFLCGCREGLVHSCVQKSTQYAFLSLTERWILCRGFINGFTKSL